MATPRSEYEVALKHAEGELANHEARGDALRAAVDALKGLLASEPAPAPAPAKPRRRKAAKRKVVRRKPKAAVKRKRRKSAGAGHPKVAADHYKGLGPVKAYDKFVAEFGDDYSVPQVRDALLMGSVKSSSPTSLATSIYSVRRRRAMAAAKKPAAAEAETAPPAPDADADAAS